MIKTGNNNRLQVSRRLQVIILLFSLVTNAQAGIFDGVKGALTGLTSNPTPLFLKDDSICGGATIDKTRNAKVDGKNPKRNYRVLDCGGMVYVENAYVFSKQVNDGMSVEDVLYVKPELTIEDMKLGRYTTSKEFRKKEEAVIGHVFDRKTNLFIVITNKSMYLVDPAKMDADGRWLDNLKTADENSFYNSTPDFKGSNTASFCGTRVNGYPLAEYYAKILDGKDVQKNYAGVAYFDWRHNNPHVIAKAILEGIAADKNVFTEFVCTLK